MSQCLENWSHMRIQTAYFPQICKLKKGRAPYIHAENACAKCENIRKKYAYEKHRICDKKCCIYKQSHMQPNTFALVRFYIITRPFHSHFIFWYADVFCIGRCFAYANNLAFANSFWSHYAKYIFICDHNRKWGLKICWRIIFAYANRPNSALYGFSH